MAYFLAGNLGMPLWKFVFLDSIGALLTVPISVHLGRLFAENLDYAMTLIHRFEIPLAILGALAGWWMFRRWRTGQVERLASILQKRAGRGSMEDEAN